jgi:hypothetical protein
MNKYKPLKLDAQVIPAQDTAFVTGGQGGKGRKGAKYLQDAEWNALSPEAKSKIIEACKKGAKGGEDNDDKASLSAQLAKTIKSLLKTMRLLEKDNKKLKKSVSALQKCDKDDDMTRAYQWWKAQAISKMHWRCSRNTTPGLF